MSATVSSAAFLSTAQVVVELSEVITTKLNV